MSQRSLLRAASPLIVGRALSGILTFLVPLLLARRLSPYEFGTYKQFFLIATTFCLIGQIGLPGSLYYFVPRSGEGRGRFVIQTMATLFLIGLVCAGGLMLGTHALAARFNNPHLADLAWPLALYGLFYLGATPVEIALTAAGRTGWAAVSYVGSDLARIAALLAPIQSGLGLTGLAWCACGFALLRLVAGWTLALSGAYGPPAVPTRASVGQQLRYSLPFAGAVLLAVANTQLPQYLVATLTDVATFAVFAVGALQLPLTDSVYTPVAEVMMVRLASAPDRDAPRIFRSAVSRLVVFFLPIAALAWATAPELIVTLFTTQYQAAVPIFIIAIGELLLSSLPVDGLLRALAATRAIFLVNLARVGLSAIAVPVGLSLFGLPGAMVGYLSSQYLAKALLVRAAARRLNISAAELIPWRIVRAWTLRAAVLFGAITSLRVFGPWHRWAFFLVAGPIAVSLWGICLATARGLHRLQEQADASLHPSDSAAGASLG